MPPKPTSKSKGYKPLTAFDYLLYNQMVLSFHTLEYAATHHFLKGASDRKKLAALVDKQISLFMKALTGDQCQCPLGTCQDSYKMCKPCTVRFAPGELELLIREMGEYIDEVGLDDFREQLGALSDGLPTNPGR